MNAPKPYTAEQLDVADNRIRKTCHPKQRAFVFDPAKYTSLLTGRGAGKTVAILLRIIRQMMHRPGAKCLYIAATRESAERLAWSDLKRIVGLSLRLANAKWNESKLTLSLPNGSTLGLFGADDKSDINKLRGISYYVVGIDETASIKKELLHELLVEVIGPRMIGTLSVIGTPGKQLEGTFFEATAPAMVGTDPVTGQQRHRPWVDREDPAFADWLGWSSHSWNIKDGVDAAIPAMEEIYAAQLREKQKHGWSDSNPYWLREYMGVWASDASQNVYVYRPYDDEGKEWNQWTPKLDAHGFAILPEHIKDVSFGIGIDVGFSDAFALEVFAFSYSDPSRTLYHVYEVYKTKLYAQAIAKLLIGEQLSHDHYGGIVGRIGWPDVMVGDFAGRGGDLLTELQTVYGITIAAADKPYKYKENSIELMNSDLFDGRIKVMKGSKLADEMMHLQWVVDPYGKRVENKNQPNHACDGAMYLRNALAKLLPHGTVAEPPPMKRREQQPEPEYVPRQEPEYGNADDMYAPGEW